MKTKLTSIICSLASLVGLMVQVVVCSATPFAYGDVLVNNFNGGNIQRYDSAGNLQQTYTGSGGLWYGAAITPQGNIATVRRSPVAGVNVFNQVGVQILTFDAPAINIPGDISVFADGTMAISSQLGGTVEFYSSTGAHLRSVSGPNQPFGSAVGPDGTLWVGGVGGVGFGFKHFNEDGTLLGSFSTSFMPGDVVVDSLDGTLWVAERHSSAVAHLDTSGAMLGSFAVDFSFYFDGIAMAPDRTFYLVDENDPRVLHYSETGTLLSSFAIASPNVPLFVAVVPEPSSCMLLITCLSLSLYVGERTKRCSLTGDKYARHTEA